MVDQNRIIKCEELSRNIRKKIVEMSECSQDTMHWGGSLSCVEVLAVLYGDTMNMSCYEKSVDIDKFLLSKGHAALGLYATLNCIGKLTDNDVMSYQQDGSMFTELVEYNPQLGFECSGGSLGMGLPYATGMALLAKKRKYDYKVYVLLGDGELDEGSVWEAIMFASQMHLDNLTIVIDYNKFQSDGCTDDIISWSSLSDRLKAFGWNAIDVDGHSVALLLEAFSENKDNMPTAIVAHTIKGKGISFMENDNSWHDRKITSKELLVAKQEVGLEC